MTSKRHVTLRNASRTAGALLWLFAAPGSIGAQDGPVVCWGGSPTTVCTEQLGNFTQISAGGHSLGLRPDGTIECWGGNPFPGGECAVPSGTFTQIAAGGNHSVALRTDGTLACWGDNDWGQSIPPAGTFVRVAAGMDHSVAIRTDGTVACWGRDSWGQATPPAGTFVDIAASYYNSVGIRSDGTLACWGDNSEGQCLVPSGTYTQVAMGEWGGVALTPGGSIECWGWDPYYGQCDEKPAGSFVEISAFFNHIVARRASGTVVCWGVPGSDPCDGKPCGYFSQISAGANYTLGIVATGSTQEPDIPDQCSLYLSKWGDGLGDWPAQQGIAHDGQYFYTSGGTCGPLGATRIVKWDPDPGGSDGWNFVTQNKAVDECMPGVTTCLPTCHIGGIDVANGSVYAVLSDFSPTSPVTAGYLRSFKSLDLSLQWELDLSPLISAYDFEDFAGVGVGPEGYLYVVTYQSDPAKSTYIFQVNPSGGALEAVYPIETTKANGIDIVDGVIYVAVDLSPGFPDPEPRGAIEVYEELCDVSPGAPTERRIFDIPPGAYFAKHAEGLAVVSDDEIWTAQWTHAVKLGTGGQPDPFCHGPSGLVADASTLSLAAGGTQTLELGAGMSRGGEAYIVLGSETGTSPGIAYGIDTIPLNLDPYLLFTLNHPNTPPLGDSLGFLDASGGAVMTIAVPPGFEPGLAGVVLDHAAIVFDLASGPAVSFVSNPTPLVLLP